MADALHTAWQLRVEMNKKRKSPPKKPAKKKAPKRPKRD
jgi:hypothetical protein